MTLITLLYGHVTAIHLCRRTYEIINWIKSENWAKITTSSIKVTLRFRSANLDVMRKINTYMTPWRALGRGRSWCTSFRLIVRRFRPDSSYRIKCVLEIEVYFHVWRLWQNIAQCLGDFVWRSFALAFINVAGNAQHTNRRWWRSLSKCYPIVCKVNQSKATQLNDHYSHNNNNTRRPIEKEMKKNTQKA